MDDECRLIGMTDVSFDEEEELAADRDYLKPAKVIEPRKFVVFRPIKALESSMDSIVKSPECSRSVEGLERCSERSSSGESPDPIGFNSTKGQVLQKFAIKGNSVIKPIVEDPTLEARMSNQEDYLNRKGDFNQKSEELPIYKRSPSNKAPVKAFAGMEVINGIEEKSSKIRLQPSKKNKFSFGELTIDVEEANKQMLTGKAPLQITRIVSPPPPVAVQQVENKETIEFIRAFYQEQIDKLILKNESLLRENERLKVELSQTNHHAAECKLLRIQLSEFQKRLDGQSPNSKDCAYTGTFGEIKLNPKTKLTAEGSYFERQGSDKLFQSLDTINKDSMPNSAKVKKSEIRRSQLGQVQFHQ